MAVDISTERRLNRLYIWDIAVGLLFAIETALIAIFSLIPLSFL